MGESIITDREEIKLKRAHSLIYRQICCCQVNLKPILVSRYEFLIFMFSTEKNTYSVSFLLLAMAIGYIRVIPETILTLLPRNLTWLRAKQFPCLPGFKFFLLFQFESVIAIPSDICFIHCFSFLILIFV